MLCLLAGDPYQFQDTNEYHLVNHRHRSSEPESCCATADGIGPIGRNVSGATQALPRSRHLPEPGCIDQPDPFHKMMTNTPSSYHDRFC
jgi:hypothetical protein